MNPLVRNILIIGTVLVLVSLIGGFALWVLPVEAQIAQLNQQLEQEKGNREAAKKALEQMEASTSVIRQQLDTLALFDLREEQDPENVLQTRSNSQLIQVSKILEEASVSVSELNLDRSENVPIGASGSTPIASVQKQHFRLHATGFYRDFLAAFDRLKRLPPTVAVNNYTVTYAQKVGNQAKVDVQMDVSFNFLMKPVASASAGTGGSAASAFEQMMMKLSGKGGMLLERLLKVADGLLGEPAYAATGRLEVSARAIRLVPDEPVSFRTFRLRDGRVVVDMPGLRVLHKQTVRVGRGGVRTVRLGQLSTHPLIGRLVLDTSGIGLAPRRGPDGGVVIAIAGGREVPPPPGRSPVRPDSDLPVPDTRHLADVAPPDRSQDGLSHGRPEPIPAVRATPLPAQAKLGATSLSRPQPAPEPEPEPIIRRVAVKPWKVGEIRRVVVKPRIAPDFEEIRRVDVRPEEPVIVVAPALAPVLVNNPTGMAVLPGRRGDTFQVVAAPPGARPLVPPSPGGPSSMVADATGSLLPGRKMGVGLPEVPIGRAEPFFPLFDATDDIGIKAWEASRQPQASPSATASATPAPQIAQTPPPPAAPPAPIVQAPVIPQIVLVTPAPPPRLAVTLRGVLMAGDRAYGLFDVNGQTVRATVGSSLGPGYEVKAMGKNFALVSSPFGTERKNLATTWVPVMSPPTLTSIRAGAGAADPAASPAAP